ncbi:hypothetical protein, partial [Neobacillus bataviensis]|uniref:hypothetical protein n=1 Tax=Neobacillus bataviensis TaxID=220685 RepID=UPI001C97996F
LTDGLYGTIVYRPSSPSHRTSMDVFNTFSFFVVKSWFLAIHGWLTGEFSLSVFLHKVTKKADYPNKKRKIGLL